MRANLCAVAVTPLALLVLPASFERNRRARFDSCKDH